MPNISTTNTNAIYKYSASITLPFDEENPVEVDSTFIKGIVIDYNYDENNFPLIYITISTTKKVRDLLLQHQDSGTLIFTLKKYVENSDLPGLKVDYINDKFVYFMPSSASNNDEETVVHNPDDRNDIVKVYTLGLISLTHINNSKKTVNGVIKKATKSSVINYILQNHNLLMEPLQYNSILQGAILPPTGSVSKAIKYFNSLEVFYDTPYRFFMDFGVTYLTSSSGKLIERKGSEYNNVIINLRNDYNEANMEGMISDKDMGAYFINASSTFSNNIDSSANIKGYDKINAATTIGNKLNATIVPIDNNTSEIKSKSSNIRLPNNNTGLLKNIEYQNKLNLIVMTINSSKIDASVITMDKIYNINADLVYGSNYTGQYLLHSKKEVYTNEGEGLALNINMIFKKIPS